MLTAVRTLVRASSTQRRGPRSAPARCAVLSRMRACCAHAGPAAGPSASWRAALLAHTAALPVQQRRMPVETFAVSTPYPSSRDGRGTLTVFDAAVPLERRFGRRHAAAWSAGLRSGIHPSVPPQSRTPPWSRRTPHRTAPPIAILVPGRGPSATPQGHNLPDCCPYGSVAGSRRSTPGQRTACASTGSTKPLARLG